MSQTCPQCGSPSKLLFNLVTCVTPKCRNYDAKWSQEWLSNFGPIFNNTVYPGYTDFTFLGRFVASGGTKFDLYMCRDAQNQNGGWPPTFNPMPAQNGNGPGAGGNITITAGNRPRTPNPALTPAPTPIVKQFCIARYGNNPEQAYYVDSKETEIGVIGGLPVQSVSQAVKDALKHAISLFRKRRKFNP